MVHPAMQDKVTGMTERYCFQMNINLETFI